MNAVTTTSPHGHGDNESHQIDRLLCDFFRSEVPSPWPALQPPAELRAPNHTTRSWSAPHWALASSIAALIIGGWLMSGRMPAKNPAVGTLDDGAAKVPSMLRSGDNPSISPTPRR